MGTPIARLRGELGEPRRMRGLTLIELMVVVVIIGILVAIAYPGYQSQIQKTRRADGKTALLGAAQRLERCFTRYNRYDHDDCDAAVALADAEGVLSDQEWYVVTFDGAVTASTFALVATPQGQHTNDTICANLRLNNVGTRDATGTAPDTCW